MNQPDSRRSERCRRGAPALGAVLSIALLGLSGGVQAEVPPLVDVDWIKANGCNADVRVLDIRSAVDGGSRTDYLRGHIPCAVYTDYKKDGWRAKDQHKTPGQLAPVDKLTALIGRLGIGNDTRVVIVPAGNSALDMGSATRIYWTLKVLGHDDVSILDGGMAAYTKDDKNPLEKGSNSPDPVEFVAEVREDMIPDKADIRAAMDEEVVLVDHRPHDQFIGINRHPKATRNGTIPGARNLPESWLTENNGGSFRDIETLKRLYALAEVPTDGPQINFCNSGHWATLGWFVSHELLGNEQARAYDGSMIEWSRDASLPMAQEVTVTNAP